MKNLFSKNDASQTLRGLGLQTQILAILLLVSLVPVGVVAVVSVNQTQSALTSAAESSLRAGAAQIATSLDSTIKSNLSSIRAEAQQDVFVKYLGLSTTEQAVSSDLENSVRSGLVTLSLKDPNYIRSYALVSLSGTVLVDTVDANVGKSEKTADYFINVLNTQVQYVTPVTYNENGDLIIHFASPVRDSNGTPIGVLRAEYRAAILQDLINKSIQETGQTITVILFDEYNIRIADSSDPQVIQKSLTPLDTDTFNKAVKEGRLLPSTPQEQATNNTEYNQALNNSNSTPFFIVDATSSTQGADVVAVASLKTKPWKVAYSQSQSAFLADVQRQTNTNIVIVIGVAILVAILAFGFSRQLTTPIKELTEVASELSAGNMQARSSITSRDEIGVLASTLNKMAVDLQQSREVLEQRVVERTKALATVSEISTAASTILDIDKLLQEVVGLTKERFGLYHAHIYLLNEAADTLVLAAGAGEPGRQMVSEGRSIPLDREQSLVARAARERKGVTVNDVTQAPDFLPNPLLPNTRSELAVPMMVGENVIGVFDVQSDEVGRFTEADISVQTTLASQIASAVQNARLYAQAEITRQEAQSLVDYATEGILVLDLETGLFTEPNESATKIYGLPREELVKVGPAQMSPPTQPDGRDSTEKALEMIGGAMQTGTAISEWMHRDAQGHDFLCEIHLTRLPGAHPRLRTTVTDITERKRAEELTRQRAQHQEALNLITQKIQGAMTVEAALQVAARELGHALGMKPTLVTLDPSALTGDRKGN